MYWHHFETSDSSKVVARQADLIWKSATMRILGSYYIMLHYAQWQGRIPWLHRPF